MKWSTFYALLLSALNQKAESLLIETREGEEIVDLRNKRYYDLVGWDRDGYFWKDDNYNAVLQKYQRVSYLMVKPIPLKAITNITMETFIVILLAIITIVYGEMFFKDIDNGDWGKSTDLEGLVALLSIVLLAFIVVLL